MAISKSKIQRIIDSHIEGLPRAQIAPMTGYSTGSVSNIIQSWKKVCRIDDLEGIRKFMKEVHKTGHTVKELATALPFLNILKEFFPQETKTGSVESKHKIKEIFSFILELYKCCNDQGISPSIIPVWIKDFNEMIFELQVSEDKKIIKKEPIYAHSNTFGDSKDKTKYQDRTKTTNEYMSKAAPISTSEPSSINTFNKSHSNNTLLSDNEIPLISTFYSHIESLKEKYDGLKKKIQNQKNTVIVLRVEENRLRSSINHLEIKESKDRKLAHWYHSLKMALKSNYGLQNDEIRNFARVINEFSKRGFDPNEILKEYFKAISLRNEIETLQQVTQKAQIKKNALESCVSFYQYQIEDYRDHIKTLNALKKLGLGYEELMRMIIIIDRISEMKKIDHKEAAKHFYKEIKDRYQSSIHNTQISGRSSFPRYVESLNDGYADT